VKPVRFKYQNVVYAENQPEYLPLPAHRNDEGTVTSCWKLNLWERLLILFTGKIWWSVMTFGDPQLPAARCPLKVVEDNDGPNRSSR